MKTRRNKDVNAYSQRDWNAAAGQYGNEPSDERRLGRNFGEGSRPYGEEYGEDTGDERERNDRSRGVGRNRLGYNAHNNSDRGDIYARYEDPYDLSGEGYASRGFDKRTGSHRGGFRGFNTEDYQDYRDIEQQRYEHGRNVYPDTYRSAKGGYMSEHVGDDLSRRDYPYQNYERYGQHTGKGPRNYKRSDERIQEIINDRLTDDDIIDATEIEVSVKDGEVTLKGIVNDRAEKRRAEDVAESAPGVTQVVNLIRIGSSPTRSSTAPA